MLIKNDKLITKLTDYVIKRLNENVSLEKIHSKYGKNNYIIAGGAVANIIFEYLYEIPAVIRDIDIFFKKKYTDEDEEILNNLENIKDLYNTIRMKNSFLKKITYEGNKNLIEVIERINTKDYYFFPLDIIMSFDLNCVQVGISNNRLIYTDNFLNFLIHKKIKLNSDVLYTYFSTITRILKKQKDLQLSSKENPELFMFLSQLIIHYMSSHESMINQIKNYHCYNFIDLKFYKTKIEPIIDELEKYFFIMLVKDDDGKDKYTIFPKMEANKKFQKLLDSEYIYFLNDLFRYDINNETKYKNFLESCSGENFKKGKFFLPKF